MVTVWSAQLQEKAALDAARIRRDSEGYPVARAEVPAIAMLFPGGVYITVVGFFRHPLARNRHIVVTIPARVAVSPDIAATYLNRLDDKRRWRLLGHHITGVSTVHQGMMDDRRPTRLIGATRDDCGEASEQCKRNNAVNHGMLLRIRKDQTGAIAAEFTAHALDYCGADKRNAPAGGAFH